MNGVSGDTSLKKHAKASKPGKDASIVRHPGNAKPKHHGSGGPAGAACGCGASFRGKGSFVEPETGDRYSTDSQRASGEG